MLRHGPGALDHHADQIHVAAVVVQGHGACGVFGNEVHDGNVLLLGVDIGILVGLHVGHMTVHVGGRVHAVDVHHVVVEDLAVKGALIQHIAVPVAEGDGVGSSALHGSLRAAELIDAVRLLGLLHRPGAGEVQLIQRKARVEHTAVAGNVLVEVEVVDEIVHAFHGEGVVPHALGQDLGRVGFLGRRKGAGGQAQHQGQNDGKQLLHVGFLLVVYPLIPPISAPFSSLSWKMGSRMMIGTVANMIRANWIRYRE